MRMAMVSSVRMNGRYVRKERQQEHARTETQKGAGHLRTVSDTRQYDNVLVTVGGWLDQDKLIAGPE